MIPAAPDFDTARKALREAGELLHAARAAHARASAAFERAVQHPLNAPFNTAPASDGAVTDHRRNHRPGRPAIIDTDLELQAFIRARLDRFTFIEIADQVAAVFPPARRVSKSAIHACWRRNHK